VQLRSGGETIMPGRTVQSGETVQFLLSFDSTRTDINGTETESPKEVDFILKLFRDS